MKSHHLFRVVPAALVLGAAGGAGGTIGTEIAIRAQPDGYTLLIISVTYAYNPSIYKLPYDPLKAVVPVALLGTGPNALAVHPSVPAKSVKELIAPAGVSPAIVTKVNTEIAAILATPETQKWFLGEGGEAVSKTPDEFRKWIVSEMARWGKVVKAAGIKAE